MREGRLVSSDALSEADKGGWVAVARLLRPQGRRGELLAEALTDVPGLLTQGAALWRADTGAVQPDSHAAAVTVEDLWEPTGKNAGRVVLKLAGCDSISQAEALAGRQLMIRSEELPPLEENTFYVRDLLGCTLYDGETAVGEVVDVQFATSPDGRRRLEDAAPLLEVQPAGSADTVLVPFVRAYLVRADVGARRVEMQLPAGLVEGDSGGELSESLRGEVEQEP